MDFPTLGLNFDLNELIEGQRRLAQTKGEFLDLGRAADRAGDQAEAAGHQISGASLEAEAAAFRAARGHNAEEQALKGKMRQARDLERALRDLAMLERLQKRLDDPATKQFENQRRAVRALGQTIELVTRENQRLAMQQQQGWNRVADAIRMAADQTVRAANADAEARVRITQAEIAQNRQNALTRESLTKEALLVDRLTRELQELGQARSNSARQSAPAGANANLLGAAAATSVMPVIANARSGLDNRAAQLAENEAREKGRRGIMSYMLALVGLGGAYDSAGNKQRGFGGGLGGLGNALRQVRLRVFDLRFAVAALVGALTLGPLAAMADQMVSLEARTKLYAKAASDVPFLLELTYQTAQRARAPLEGIATLYTRLAPLADQLGRSQTQLLRVTETVAKAFAVGGAAASEATAGAQQFAQAIASNRFGGDELRSVAENAPILLKAIADGINQLSKEGFAGIDAGLNLNAATFIKWAQSGKASAEVMVAALERSQEAIDRAFSSFPVTISQATAVVGNAFQRLVDEVDRRSGEMGQRLSTTIATSMAGFADFLTQQSTIDAIVGTINALKVSIGFLGDTAKTAADYFPTLVAGVVAFSIAANRALIVTGLTAAMSALQLATTAVGLAFTGASGRALVLASAQTMVRNTAAAAMTAMGGLAGIMTGGILIAITGLVFAWNAMSNAQKVAADAASNYAGATEGAVGAIERAIAFNDLYKRNTDALTAAMREEAGMSAAGATATDGTTSAHQRAAEMALIRANAERELTRVMLERIAVESGKRAEELDRSVNGFFGLRSQEQGLISGAAGSPTNPAYQRRIAEATARRIAAEEAAQKERDRQTRFENLAKGLETPLTAADVTIPAAAGPPTGVPAVDNKSGKGMAGAINAVAKLRAEVDGLNAQIRALSIDPLSDAAARIIAAGDEAAAARTAGKGAGFADEAEMLAMLKEEATIRMDLARTIVEQNAASVKAAQESRIGLWANGDAMRAMSGYYDGAGRSSERYVQALYAQSEAEVEGKKTLENLRLAQQFGVTSISEIGEAYRATLEEAGLLTEETAAYGDQLQAQAQAAYNAAAAAIDLNTQLERQQRLNAAILDQRRRTDDLVQYAAALRGGAAALDAYNRQKRIQAQLDAEGPAPTMVGRILQPLMASLRVSREDEAGYTAEYEKRSAEMREQLRMSELTTREREVEVEAMELAAAAGRSLANEADRAAAKMLIAGREAAAMATTVKDSIRQGFIESGELSFDSLKEALAKSIRQTLYDELVAKPVDLVVKAVLEFQQKGMDAILAYIKKALGGDEGGSIFDALGKFFGEGGKFGNFMSQFGATGSKIAGAIQGVAAIAPQLYAAYEANKMIVSGLGNLIGLSDAKQANADKAASFGAGPLGALLYGMFADTKRALALTAVQVIDGRFKALGSKAYDGGPLEEIDAAGKQLASALNKLTRAFDLSLQNVEGLYAVFGWTAGENTKSLGGEGFFGGMLKEWQSIQGKSLDQIKGSALGRGIDFSQVKDAETALDKIMREVIIKIGAAQDIPFTEAEKALIRAADSLEEAAATLKAARNVETDIQRALLQYTNPREFAVQNLRDSQLERRQGILDLVDQGLITEDRLPGIETMLRELEAAELRDTLSKFVEGIDGVISSLEDLQNAQKRLADYAQGLITGNLSPLSPSAQLTASQAEYQRLLAAANAGDATAMEKLTSASTDYLSAAQRYFASSPQYAAIFDEVYNQLLALSTKEFEDPLIGVIEAEVQRLIDAINAGFLLIYNGDPTAPDLPDSPPVPGTGGTGTGGGGTGGWPNGPDGRDVVDTLNDRFDRLEDRVAGMAEAVVAANDRNGYKTADAVATQGARQAALRGGVAV